MLLIIYACNFNLVVSLSNISNLPHIQKISYVQAVFFLLRSEVDIRDASFILSVIPSIPASLLKTHKASVFFFTVFIFLP